MNKLRRSTFLKRLSGVLLSFIIIAMTLPAEAIHARKRTHAHLTPPDTLTVEYPQPVDISISGGGLIGRTVTYTVEEGSDGTIMPGTTQLVASLAGTYRIRAEMAGNSRREPVYVEYDVIVQPKPITIVSTEIEDKVYDGSDSAFFAHVPALNGVEPADEDEVFLELATPVFSDQNVGVDKTVFFTDFEITGAKCQNYVIEQPDPEMASIHPRVLTVSAQSQTVTYSEEIPLEVVVTGFAPGESEEYLAGLGYIQPAATCGMSRFSAAGTYNDAISVAISSGHATDNYVFSYEAGDLVIQPGPAICDEHYTVTVPNGENGWFNGKDGDFVVRPIQGTTSSYDEISIDNVNWSDELRFSVNKKLSDVSFFLRDSVTGAVSSPEAHENYQIDRAAPDQLKITYSDPFLSKDFSMITLGYYKPSVTVTLSAVDETSGVESFDWTYTRARDASSTNVETVSGRLQAVQSEKSDTTYTASFTLNADTVNQFRGSLSFTATDRAGNHSALFDDGDNTVVVDTIAPRVQISRNGPLKAQVEADPPNGHKPARGDKPAADGNTRFIYSGPVTVTVEVTEANFYPNGSPNSGEYDGNDILITATHTLDGVTTDVPLRYTRDDWTQKGDVWTLPLAFSGDGDYVVTVAYSDRSGNDMEWSSDEYAKKMGKAIYTSQILTIDTTNPTLDVTFAHADSPSGDGIFRTGRTAVIRVADRNFRPREVEAAMTAVNIQGSSVSAFRAAAERDRLKSWDAWHEVSPHVWEASVIFDVDARYAFTLAYGDLAGNTALPYTAEPFILDREAPQNLTISYSTPLVQKILALLSVGYYNPSVTVTLTADDEISGVAAFDWTFTRESGASTARNAATESARLSGNAISYTNNGLTAVARFTLTGDEARQYRGAVSFTASDRAGNQSVPLDDSANNMVVVDTIAPIARITFSGPLKNQVKTDASRDTLENPNEITRLIYGGDITATVEIAEANFYPDDVLISASKTVDGVTTDVPLRYTEGSWTRVGDNWALTLTLSGDGDYVVTITYTDRSLNGMEWSSDEYAGKAGSTTYISNILTIDTTQPVIRVTFDPAVSSAKDNIFHTERTAVIQITDRNFRPYEIEAPTLTAQTIQGRPSRDFDADAVISRLRTWGAWREVSRDVWEAVVVFNVDAKFSFTLTYKDLVGNTALPYTAEPFTVDRKAPRNLRVSYATPLMEQVLSALTFGYYNPSVTVTLTADDETSGVSSFHWTYNREMDASVALNVETESGYIGSDGITLSNDGMTASATFTLTGDQVRQYRGGVSFTATDRAGNESNLFDDSPNHSVVVDTISPTRTVTFPAPKQIVRQRDQDVFYYDGDVTATIVVTEANFYGEDVVAWVNDSLISPLNWSRDGDEYKSTVTLSGDGDYIITLSYTDRSDNQMVHYTSDRITIDTTDPVIWVVYDPQDAIRELPRPFDGKLCKYFSVARTATITVIEHNFRAEDFAGFISAKDVTGADTAVSLASSLTARLRDPENWTADGDRHTAAIVFSADANYTFTADYQDLALRKIAAYTEDVFTVDTTAPTNLNASYSASLLETVLETVTFGYYNAKMTVTVTADDDTAGIYRFDYSCFNGVGVSDLNMEWLDQALAHASVQYTHNGRGAECSFTIPKDDLARTEQFNGSVRFTAFDRCENGAEKLENQRVVVDNIAPTMSISYSSPVKEFRGISYYAGDIDVTVQMNEANFYSEDISILVSKDGAAGAAVAAVWSDDGGELHTGSFTLREDGDYIVMISYRDRSDNQMEDYRSHPLTIDTQKPVVRLDGITHESANNQDLIGFTVTAGDRNFDASSFDVVLTAVVRDENGVFQTKILSEGVYQTIAEGKQYVYTVENLDTDGLYSLTCAATDLSGNTAREIIVTENGEAVSALNFSVNRNGSVFGLDEHTGKLLENYYTQNVYQDIVVSEINVDPLLSRIITLNGAELEENIDYFVERTGGGNKWNRYVYRVKETLFEAEGEYKVVLHTGDKAGNDAYSDLKDVDISFVVDQTAPVVTISGLRSNGSYQTDRQIVTIIPKDDGGKLKSLKVMITDNAGNAIRDASGMDVSVRLELEGDELPWAIEQGEGKLTFDIPSGLSQNVRIICTDYAQNQLGQNNIYDEAFDHVTVSSNVLVIVYANKPLFFSTIASILVLMGLLWFFLFLRGRKKEKDS